MNPRQRLLQRLRQLQHFCIKAYQADESIVRGQNRLAEIQNMKAPGKRSLKGMVKADPRFWLPVYLIGFAYLLTAIFLDVSLFSFRNAKSTFALLLALGALVYWGWSRVKVNEKYNVQLQ